MKARVEVLLVVAGGRQQVLLGAKNVIIVGILAISQIDVLMLLMGIKAVRQRHKGKRIWLQIELDLPSTSLSLWISGTFSGIVIRG